MSSGGSVTHWVREIQDGDFAVARELWECYFPRLVRLARQKLAGVRRGASDEEDVALSAFNSFCLAAERGRFPDLADRDSLWQLLLQMTARKAIDRRRHESRKRRGGGKVLGDSAIVGRADSDGDFNERAIDAVIGDEPAPVFAVMMAEQCQRLLELLGDADLRAIAIAAMEGYSNEQSALLRKLFLLELDYRQRAGESPSPEKFTERFPNDRAQIESVFADDAKRRAASSGVNPPPAARQLPETTSLPPAAPTGSLVSTLAEPRERMVSEANLAAAVESGWLRDEGVARERLGRLKQQCWRATHVFDVCIERLEEVTTKARLRITWERNARFAEWAALSEGCYLQRSNVVGVDAATLWRRYIQLTEAEWAFRITKDELSIRPIWHQNENRVKAHILVCFLAYVLWKTLNPLEWLSC